MARLCRSIFTRFSPQPLTLFWNVCGREWATAELNLPSRYDLSRKSQPRRQWLPPLLTYTLFRAHKRTDTHLRNDSGEIALPHGGDKCGHIRNLIFVLNLRPGLGCFCCDIWRAMEISYQSKSSFALLKTTWDQKYTQAFQQTIVWCYVSLKVTVSI